MKPKREKPEMKAKWTSSVPKALVERETRWLIKLSKGTLPQWLAYFQGETPTFEEFEGMSSGKEGKRIGREQLLKLLGGRLR